MRNCNFSDLSDMSNLVDSRLVDALGTNLFSSTLCISHRVLDQLIPPEKTTGYT